MPERFKLNLDRPVADQILEEAGWHFVNVQEAQVEYDKSGLPSQKFLDALHVSLLNLVEVGEAQQPDDPWPLIRRGLRRLNSGLDKNKLFCPGGILQPEILEDVRERQALYSALSAEAIT